MEGPDVGTTRYAILIGIDNYPGKPLKCCVRDVRDFKEYFEKALSSHVEICTLTASLGDQPVPYLDEDLTTRPTRENIISAFENVKSRAKDEGFVYVHFSGHGTRNPATGDLALVLVGRDKHSVSYLWGRELALLVNGLVNKGLIVTVGLDCCFSASTSRHDEIPDNAHIRFFPYNPTIASDSSFQAGYLGDKSECSMLRDASMRLNWLVNPDKYAILAACGPHELAIGPKFDGHRHGALTYYLLEVLKATGPTHNLGIIYDYLRAKFTNPALKRKQKPAVYGNRNRGFFGPTRSGLTQALIPVTKEGNGSLKLQAGCAHGIEYGDEFVLYPLKSAEPQVVPNGHSVKTRVVHSNALTSDLKLTSPSSTCVRTAWVARALSRLCLRKYLIVLVLGDAEKKKWTMSLSKRSLDFHFDMSDQSFLLKVVLCDRQYKVLDEYGQPIANLPEMPQDKTSIEQVSDVLEHLVRFISVKDLAHDSTTDHFQRSFSVHISSNGKTYSPGSLIEVENNMKGCLTIENYGEHVLYCYVYDLGPEWQVDDVFQGTWHIIPREEGAKAKAIETKWLEMRISEALKREGCRSCEDTIKVFITSLPTSFGSLELPKLGQPAVGRRPVGTSTEGNELRENWATVSFPIRTFLP